MIVICPGVHDPELTESFVAQLQRAKFWPSRQNCTSPLHPKPLIFPTQLAPVYSPAHVLEFLQKYSSLQSSLVLVCFSAGVVGAIGAARTWQRSGGKVRALIALDGWGVPLGGDFLFHRISHDHFTYWSSQLLGAGADSFYADPPVKHLDLWRSPQAAQGWWVQLDRRERTTAATFINLLLERYGESV